MFGLSSSTIVLPSSLKELPDNLKGSALIQISTQGESCRNAIKSILKAPKFFEDVHIVFQAFTGDDHSFYPDYANHRKELIKLGLDPILHSTLNLQKYQTLLEIEIPPDCKAKPGTFMSGLDSMAYPSCNEAGVSSQLSLVQFEDTTAKEHLEAFCFYGFLLPLLFLDACRSFIRAFQYHRTADVRFRRLSQVYPSTNRAPSDRWFLWWIGTGISISKRGHDACIQRPREQGISFVMRTIKTHRYLNWIGVWWIGLGLYYVLFALPWWNFILSPTWGLGSYIVRDIFQLRWILWYIFHILLLGMVTWSSVDEYPNLMLGPHVLLSSFYLTFLPLFIVICKIYQLKSNSIKKKQKRKEN